MKPAKKLLHLYWRASFGISPQQWGSLVGKSPQSVAESLCAERPFRSLPMPDLPSLPGPNATAEERNAFRKSGQQSMLKMNKDWLHYLAFADYDPLLERMSLFWHGHFACESKHAYPAVGQVNAIRKNALGNFRDLVLAVSRDPLMIRYLNNQQNRKERPNENFARELMELFTIGRGHYTEADVKAGARAFTGWSSDRMGNFVFRRRFHDYEEKTFMGETGNWGGEEVIDIILSRPETAQFIVRKIYRYFVNEVPDEGRVNKLADAFFRSNYDIRQLMRSILTSDWFYEQKNIGTKIKSPVELLVGLERQLQLSEINPKSIVGLQRALGQILFRPPNVAGWPGGQSWIDNSTLTLRMQIPRAIFGASEIDFSLKSELEEANRRRLRKMEARIDFQPLIALSRSATPSQSVEKLIDYLLIPGTQIPSDQLASSLGADTSEAGLAGLCAGIMSLPEYQLC